MNEFVLKNRNGMSMRVTEYGGSVMELHVPDRDGFLADVTLGYDSAENYASGNSFFGTLVGRYGNRIAKGRFSLGDEVYELETNNGENHLHGGSDGFHRRHWKGETISGDDFEGVRLECRSQHGEGGYPGSLDVTVVYKLTDQNEWIIEYEAVSDRLTVVNLTQHAYFNLAGHDSGDVLDHELAINAKSITPVDSGLIPTGALMDVARTAFDFRQPKRIGTDLEAEDEQLKFGGGYDHNFILEKNGANGTLESAATVYGS